MSAAPTPALVTLTALEVLHAAMIGITRNVSSFRHGRALEHGRDDLGFERHALGAIGEYAVARELDRCWRTLIGPLDTDSGDVAGVQVKTTTRPDGCLIVRTNDPATHRYVLAIVQQVGSGFEVTLAGWLDGDAAKQPYYWRERNPAAGIHRAAYFVPQTELRAMHELKGER